MAGVAAVEVEAGLGDEAVERSTVAWSPVADGPSAASDRPLRLYVRRVPQGNLPRLTVVEPPEPTMEEHSQ